MISMPFKEEGTAWQEEGNIQTALAPAGSTQPKSDMFGVRRLNFLLP